MKVSGPLTFVDTSGKENHWDLGFIFLGERETVPKSDVWWELKFVEVAASSSGTTSSARRSTCSAYAGRWKTQ